ncbi:hypothetical protein CTI12_AA376420 [Artemisia annua]|uniref:beta-galactosidase n=1 Tax=Artemisia annua TaxID=35608 RepID=A0A2U1MII6_ARTAN|nr:hypothetical protein CTI12_AA376420 [Artemisia annua]
MSAIGKILKGCLANLKMKIGDMTADGGDHGLKGIFQKAKDEYKTHTIHSRSPLTQKKIDLSLKDADYLELVPPVLSILKILSDYLIVIPAIAIVDAGMLLILRIGPFVVAGWNYGGIPVWLHYVKGTVFRTDNEPFKINTCNSFYCDDFKPAYPTIPKIWIKNWPGCILSVSIIPMVAQVQGIWRQKSTSPPDSLMHLLDLVPYIIFSGLTLSFVSSITVMHKRKSNSTITVMIKHKNFILINPTGCIAHDTNCKRKIRFHGQNLWTGVHTQVTPVAVSLLLGIVFVL